MDRPPKSNIRHRQVWYFHGFDPATTKRYRRIFEAASDRLGVTITDLAGDDDGWRVTREGVVTDIRYCRYEDLVRAYQVGPIWQRIWRGAQTVLSFGRYGALATMMRYGPRSVALMLAPVGVPLALVSGAALVTAAWVPGALGIAIGLVLGCALAGWAFKALFLHLVADLFAYMRDLAGGDSVVKDAYLARIAELSDGIAAAKAGDEVLLVGHSLGGVGAITALERLIGQAPQGPRVGLVTLGSVHGLVLAQSGSGRDHLAQAIRSITASDRAFWLDVSAPRDAFCLPLLDPLLLTGGGPGLTSPRVISAQLRHAPKIPGDRRTVFSAMRRHMGYLLAPQSGSGFDYADTVTGAQSLADRYAGRGNSPRARMFRADEDRRGIE